MGTISVTDYLERTAKRFSEKMAFVDEKMSLSFRDLRDEARCLAMGLIQRNFFKKPIVIFMEKCPRCVAAFLGVAYSGNFYTPIDTRMPKERIKKIMEILSPVAVITDGGNAAVVKEFAGDVTVLLYEELLLGHVQEAALAAVTTRITDADILYVLFTSGSTGQPKGVVVPHRGVIAYTEWVSQEFSMDDRTVLGNQTPFYFSMSVLDIFQTLKNGCTTYIIPHELFSFPIRLLEYIAAKGINALYWVPSALCLVANLKALGHVEVPALEKILFAGEVMPVKQLNMWRRAFPHCLFANLFGPTEVTDICTYFRVEREMSNRDPLPIGKPCKNSGVLVLDEHDNLVQDGSLGELCVYGSTLAYGYYHNPGKTAAVFTQNPLQGEYPEIIYRTGDLVRYNEEGELLYAGRKDFQIKHMGHRIELGEIETAVSSLDGIEHSCCLYDELRSRIVLFFTGEIEESAIGQRLRALIPEYMIPNRTIRLEEMPLNLNGKIDRTNLKGRLKG